MVVSQPSQASRHASGGAQSARGLLFTVLGEFVLPTSGTCWTSALIEVLGRLGVAQKATRQALLRTAADGWLAAERHGRRTKWWLTPAAEELLTNGAARIYSFRSGQAGWDGQWLVVLARVPESDRATRHQLRTGLTRAGLGSPAPGVWISPHTGRAAEAKQVLRDAGLLADAHLFAASHLGGATLTSLASQAWDLAELELGYERFIAEFSPAGAADPLGVADPLGAADPLGVAEPLARVTELVHAWRRFPWADPELPAQLLPDRWSGLAAAELFAARHRDWTGPAMAEWQRIDRAG
jgi:phenylacetic acid degradation operon negative regulatory protein